MCKYIADIPVLCMFMAEVEWWGLSSSAAEAGFPAEHFKLTEQSFSLAECNGHSQ